MAGTRASISNFCKLANTPITTSLNPFRNPFAAASGEHLICYNNSAVARLRTLKVYGCELSEHASDIEAVICDG